MGYGQGMQGHVGFGAESNFGSGVAATNYIEALTENFTVDIGRFNVKNIVGGIHEPDDSAGLRTISGALSFAAHPVPLGHFLRMAFNTMSQTEVLSGFLYTNHFLTAKTADDFSNDCPPKPFTFEIYKNEGTFSEQFNGCVMNTFEMSFAPNQEVRCNAEFIGRDYEAIAKTTPTFPSSSLDPFTFDTLSLQIAGAATALVEALSVSVDNQLEGIPVIDGTNVIRKIRRTGPQMVRISGSLGFENYTEYNRFLAQTETALELSVTKASSFQMTIDIPRMQYTAFQAPIGGRGRIIANFEGKALYQTSSATAIQIDLTTTTSVF